MKRFFSVVTVCLCLLLSACGDGSQDVLRGNEYPYSIDVPHGWEVCSSLNPLADSSMKCGERRLYMIVLCEDRKDFEDDVGLSEFVGLSKESMLVTHDGAVIRDGENENEYTCSCTVNSVRVRFFVSVYEEKEWFCQLVFWTTESAFDGAYEEFKETAGAFTFE